MMQVLPLQVKHQFKVYLLLLDQGKRSSFEKVNLHQQNQIAIMANVWRNLNYLSRHTVVLTIDDFIGNTLEAETAWSAENSQKLIKYH
jgi:hypothetical protein